MNADQVVVRLRRAAAAPLILLLLLTWPTANNYCACRRDEIFMQPLRVSLDLAHHNPHQLFVGDAIGRARQCECPQRFCDADHDASAHASRRNAKGVFSEDGFECLKVALNRDLEPRLTQRKHVIGTATVFFRLRLHECREPERYHHHQSSHFGGPPFWRRGIRSEARTGGAQQPLTTHSRQTNVLVVGELGWPLLDDGRPSNKLSRAGSYGIPVVSERRFLEWIGKAVPDSLHRTYSADQIAALSKLSSSTIDELVRFGLLVPREGLFGFRDLASARQVSSLFANGIALSEIIRSVKEVRAWLPEANLSNLRLHPAAHRPVRGFLGGYPSRSQIRTALVRAASVGLRMPCDGFRTDLSKSFAADMTQLRRLKARILFFATMVTARGNRATMIVKEFFQSAAEPGDKIELGVARCVFSLVVLSSRSQLRLPLSSGISI
jgi:hypothetical protein